MLYNSELDVNCPHPILIKDKVEGYRYVPCGRCSVCVRSHRRSWACRLLCEVEYCKDCCFITLTYDDEHLPVDGQLRYSDFQKFIKRFRRNTGYHFKYFVSCEYGSKTYRPHYHFILFDFPVFVVEQQIKECWSLGFVEVLPVRQGAVYYVSQYTLKKMFDFQYKSYMHCSNGIGKDYLFDHIDEIKKNFCVTLGSSRFGIPRYFIKLIRESDPDWYRSYLLHCSERHEDITLDEHLSILKLKEREIRHKALLFNKEKL